MGNAHRATLIKWLGVVPGVMATVVLIFGLVGAHAVLAYRVEAVEADVRKDKADLDDCNERLARIEGKIDVLLERLRQPADRD